MEEKNKKKKIIVPIIVAIIIIALVAIIILLVLKLNNNSTQTDSNAKNENSENKQEIQTMSFKSMDATDTSLTDDQRAIALFFDEDYFFLETYEELVRYADMLKNINISSYCQVNTILSSDDETFEAVCQWAPNNEALWGGEVELTNPIIIKGKKPEKMVMQGDNIALKGKLLGAETRNINGESKYLPVIEIIEMGDDYLWYTDDTIRQISKLVFGDNIKVRRPTEEETFDMVNDYFYNYQDHIWLAELENQSNLNFKVFDIWQSDPRGVITYNALYNQGIEKDYLNKKLYITPDLQKYIVFDMSVADKYVYISVYDRNLNKLWQREISNASELTWDATNSNLVFVSDNDFYNINIETGEDIFNPVFVGKKADIRIVDNGYILVSHESDDSVMFLDTNGNIKNKFDITLGTKDQPNQEIYNNYIQKLDNNYVILYNIYDIDKYNDYGMYTSQEIFSSKYVIIDENGNKIKESE